MACSVSTALGWLLYLQSLSIKMDQRIIFSANRGFR